MSLETKDLKPAPPSGGAPASVALEGNYFAPSLRQFRGMIIFSVVLIIAFCRPLLALLEFAPHEELYSHILLIPFITGYLIWAKRKELVPQSQPNRALAVIPFAIGLAVLGIYEFGLRQGWRYQTPDYLAAMVLTFLCFLLAGAFLFVPRAYLKSIAFPIAFMAFCVPYPQAMRMGIEIFFQHASAYAADAMLQLARMPVLRMGTFFLMPGFSLNVQPECSGIHSSIVLLITSTLAAYMFLRSPYRRWTFILFIIPLAIVRNGFRVFTLAEIGVHFDPLILDSPFHHHGGPLFFLLSLIPLFLFLKYLIRCEERKGSLKTDK